MPSRAGASIGRASFPVCPDACKHAVELPPEDGSESPSGAFTPRIDRNRGGHMAYIVKWLGRDGALSQSERCQSPSEALAFSRKLAKLRPTRIWAEDEIGHRFPIGGATRDERAAPPPAAPAWTHPSY